MSFFKNFFSKKNKSKKKLSKLLALPERYPENSKGDFYVENQVCINCGAPQAEAPELIEHSKLEFGHCYFKKHPTTADELYRAISAMQVSCVAGIRYGGKNKAILERLYELGLQAECDYKFEDLE